MEYLKFLIFYLRKKICSELTELQSSGMLSTVAKKGNVTSQKRLAGGVGQFFLRLCPAPVWLNALGDIPFPAANFEGGLSPFPMRFS